MLLNCGVGEDSWVPWTARSSNQSLLKEINPGYSLEGLMLMLKLQYFDHLIQRTDLLEKTLMLGKIESRRRKGTTEDKAVGWLHWLNGLEFKQAPGDGLGQGTLACCSPWGHRVWTQLSNWTTKDRMQSGGCEKTATVSISYPCVKTDWK